MKLKNKIMGIGLAAMLAFTGVGFASWTFTKSVDVDVADATGKVTAAIEAKGLSVEDGSGNAVTGLYLICDAPTQAELTAASVTGLLPGNGLYWSTQADGSDTITSLTLIGEREYDANDIADINTYVGHFSADAVSAINGTWVNIASVSALDVDSSATAIGTSTVSTTWTLPVVSYVDIPESVAEVNALETEVNALDITYSFNFNIKSVA